MRCQEKIAAVTLTGDKNHDEPLVEIANVSRRGRISMSLQIVGSYLTLRTYITLALGFGGDFFPLRQENAIKKISNRENC